MLNNFNQKYEILGRFFISGAEFCRVKFATTRSEQIVPAGAVKAGNFTDNSIVAPKAMKSIVEVLNETPKEAIQKSLEALDEVVKLTAIEPVPPVQITETLNPVGLELPYDIFAFSPKGDEMTINSADLEGFCIENNLDLEVVQAVLDGKQKTHKKWRFTKA